jgi:(1->4)-alpha-D-glucan 1-alpha-D-glucosylmutase
MSDVNSWAESIAQSVAQTVRDRLCRPTSTYRIQFQHKTMTFRDAADVVPYLADLGVSHLYASPCQKVRSGSTHGYAIVDYGQLDPGLGDADDYRAMVEALHRDSLGQILDTVSNHMSAAPAENLWWTDVLENGPASPHAAFFDIDWHPIKDELQNRVLLPILGGQYGQVLESGDLKLEYRDGAFFLRYYHSLLPIEPRSYRDVLTLGLDALKTTMPPDSDELLELESIITALEHLPECTVAEPGGVAERQREKEVVKRRLHALVARAPAIADHIQRSLSEFNGTSGDPHSYDKLDKLLDAQVYRLSHWKAADDEINYRRFFDINELAAVCMELPEVFAQSHALVFELLARGDVDGLRVDHIDGLYEPAEYLRRLQREYLLALGRAAHQRATENSCGAAVPAARAGETPAPPVIPNAPPPWSEIETAFLPRVSAIAFADPAPLPLYVVVEKILAADENLPELWMSAGTTGYDFISSVNGLFVNPAGLAELTTIYDRFVDEHLDFREVAHQSKLLVFRTAMSSDLQLLAHRLNRISERHRRSRDFTLNALRTALREIFACFPIYRTYIHRGDVSERDRQVLCRAVAQAKRRNTTTDAAVFDFIRDVLLLQAPPDLGEAGRHERDLFVGRFQQVTSPVMAKGIEDTAFYRYFPLVSLNEVGSDPSRGATSLAEFHRHNRIQQTNWPQSLTGSSTHDTKRSEDARARINVLSEIPSLWRKAVNRWARLNRRHRREVDGQPAPSRNDEYLFYQNLLAVWPPLPADRNELDQLTARMIAYMEKATHEAKVHTSWINPDAEYDAAIKQFVAAALDNRAKNRFLSAFRQFHEQVVNWGLYNALSQLVLKLCSPGVPDIYQGQELWDFSLVDPDSRRPVDFAKRREMLAQLTKDVGGDDRSLLSLAGELARNPRDPRIKLLVIWRALQFRRQHAELFRLGDYLPLQVEGPKASHVCAFARRLPESANAASQLAIVVAPRLIAQLTPAADSLPSPPLGPAIWTDTRIILEDGWPATLKNVFTGQDCPLADSRLALADALADFPVALLTNL